VSAAYANNQTLKPWPNLSSYIFYLLGHLGQKKVMAAYESAKQV